MSESLIELVERLSNNYDSIIPTNLLKQYPSLYWGGNGVGDRWANKKFNYCVVYSNKKTRNYSENENDTLGTDKINDFLNTGEKSKGIAGIFVYSKRTNVVLRPIRPDIQKKVVANPCVICGTNSTIVCDHKNDLYNDERVLNAQTQVEDDFQPLCNHCNLQKRQICINETASQKLYSAKNIASYKQYLFEFPWEKKAFDEADIHCKKDTYWYDPVEFNKKIYCYMSYVIPVIKELKQTKTPSFA